MGFCLLAKRKKLETLMVLELATVTAVTTE